MEAVPRGLPALVDRGAARPGPARLGPVRSGAVRSGAVRCGSGWRECRRAAGAPTTIPRTRSYRALFRTREFTPFLLSLTAFAAAQTIGGLALGTLVCRATGSPLLSAISMFGPQPAPLLGGAFLLPGADRLPPRAVLSPLAVAFAATTAVSALPGLVASLGGGVRGGLPDEILTRDGYVLGRSVCTMLWGLVQVTGFATGGAPLTLLSPRSCLLLAAALYLTSAVTTRLTLTARPPRSSGRPSLSATWHTNSPLRSSRPRRLAYPGPWVPNGLIIASPGPGSAERTCGR
ncbi:hypothetical protein [Umezawaea sp.]|uniref:hypothetical protein n=1 Tax=Umezawaea sp. TaxID=1955258 RepID=UPI002ED4E274